MLIHSSSYSLYSYHGNNYHEVLGFFFFDLILKLIRYPRSQKQMKQRIMPFRHFGRQGRCCSQRSVLVKDVRHPGMVVFRGLIAEGSINIQIVPKTHQNLDETQAKPRRGALEDPGKISPFVIVSAKCGEQRTVGTWTSPRPKASKAACQPSLGAASFQPSR